MKIRIFLPFVLLLNACATASVPLSYTPPSPSFEAVSSMKFKSDKDHHDALTASNAACQAQSLQAAAGVNQPSPYPAGGNQVYYQAAPLYIGGSGYPQLPQVDNIDNSAALISAQQAGRARALQDEVRQSTFVGCMASRGWLTK